MSSGQVLTVSAEELPIEVHSIVNNVFQQFKDFRNIKIRTFVEDMITFFSVVGAYLCVSLSLDNQDQIEKLTGIEFNKVGAEALLLLVFAFYLLLLKVLYYAGYKYDTAPPKKVIPPGQQDMEQSSLPHNQPVQKQQQRPLPGDGYANMIEELLNYSMYGIFFMLCTTAYTYISVFNKKHNIVVMEQINYLVLWFVAACIFYSVGKIVGKMTRIKTFHHFGLTIGIIVILIEIGLAHGFNMFLFV